MGERLIRVLRWAIGITILVFVVRSFVRNWDQLRAQPIAWEFRPLPVLASVLLVWGMYAMLIEAWRRMLAGWGERLGYPEAARIWIVSSLGKYVPGKVWAIAGMALMAREAGVAAWAATASAVILQALAVGTGAAVAAGFGGAALEASHPGALVYVLVLGGAAALGVAALAYPPVTRSLLALVGLRDTGRGPGAVPILLGVAANTLAWIGYGAALWLLAAGTLPVGALSPAAAIGGFAASYVAGLVALLAPGGLLVREGVMIAMLQGTIGLGPASGLAIASRVLLTITELGAAVPFLLFRSGKPRVV